MKHDSLKLLGQATEFIFVFGTLYAFQTEMQCFLGSIERRNSGSSFTYFFTKLAEFLAHLSLLYCYMVAAFFRFRPTCLYSFPGAFATLFGSHAGGSCKTTLFTTLPP